MHSTEKLAQLISRKRDVLAHLHELGRRQIELVAQCETALLLQLLAAKQRLIEMLQSIETEIAPYRDEDPDARKWESPDSRARCAAQADECNQMLREIVAMEELGARTMTVRRDEVANQLQQINTASQVRGAYESQRHMSTLARG